MTLENRTLRIRWQVRFTKCNLKCPYCIADWTKRKVEFDPERFRKSVEALKALPYRLVIRIGVEGEFFLSPDLQEGVIELSRSPNVAGVSFSSNLEAERTRMEPFFSRVNREKLGMGCTLHDTVIGDIDDFFTKVKEINDSGVLIYVGYVAIPGRFEKIAEYKKRLDEMGVPFILNELNGIHEGKRYPFAYTAEEREFLRKTFFSPHYYRMLVERELSRGKKCNSGFSYLYMDHKSDIYGCGVDKNPPWTLAQKAAYRLSEELAGRMVRDRVRRHRIGNLLEGFPALKDGRRTCPYPECTCGNEVQSMASVDDDHIRTRTLRIIYPSARREEYEKRYRNLESLDK